jgi:hypothetical protein
VTNFSILSTMPDSKSKLPRLLPSKAPSPINLNDFTFDRWMTTTCPTKCVAPGQIGKILGFEDCCFKSKHVLCIQAFLVAAVSTTVDNGESPPGSTELNDKTGNNCKMSKDQYQAFTQLVLGLDDDTWANHRTECAFCNLIIQDLDMILHYFDTDWQACGRPISPPGDITGMAIILAWITLLLVGANACTPCIINMCGGKTKLPNLPLEDLEAISH